MSELFHVEPEAIDRRRFVRRLFAIGAGIAAGGELIRRVELIATPELMSGRAFLAMIEQGRVGSLSDHDAMMRVYSNLEADRPDMVIWSRVVEDDYVELVRRRQAEFAKAPDFDATAFFEFMRAENRRAAAGLEREMRRRLYGLSA